MTSLSEGQTTQAQSQQMSSPSSPNDNQLPHGDSQIVRGRVRDERHLPGFRSHLAWIIHEHFCLISSAIFSCTFILLGR